MNKDFESQLQLAVKKYPDLSIYKNVDGSGYLKGILNIPDVNNNTVGCFSIEIYATAQFPYRFPRVLEVGGDVPIGEDWHKYSDNSCCITVEQDEIIKCYRGITLLSFLENEVIPYFANQIYRKATGHFLNEYPHGLNGMKLFYINLFGSGDLSVFRKCLKHCFENVKFERNHECYCGSGQKYKRCHLLIEEKLQMIGEERVMSDLKLLSLL